MKLTEKSTAAEFFLMGTERTKKAFESDVHHQWVLWAVHDAVETGAGGTRLADLHDETTGLAVLSPEFKHLATRPRYAFYSEAVTAEIAAPLKETRLNPADYDLEGIADKVIVEGMIPSGDIVFWRSVDPPEFWDVVEEHHNTQSTADEGGDTAAGDEAV